VCNNSVRKPDDEGDDKDVENDTDVPYNDDDRDIGYVDDDKYIDTRYCTLSTFGIQKELLIM